jgi:hypothetical protein
VACPLSKAWSLLLIILIRPSKLLQNQWRRDRDPARIGALACKNQKFVLKAQEWLAVANRFSHKQALSHPPANGLDSEQRHSAKSQDFYRE